MLDLGTLRIGIETDDKSAKKGLQGVKKETKQVEEQTKESTVTMGSLWQKFGSIIKGAAVIGAVKQVGTAIKDIASKALDSYASFEQLTGGVETLFKDSGSTVEEYAQQAYTTAGMSANEYMDTITSFSASLISSLGGDTAKAAEAGNQAVIDMSDNANKMGTNIQDIQNAYQGFAKQNYTMLDNLKLGYGGTKEEMERLLADAEKLTGQHYDISSFNDITEAIHAIQTQMDITGTTAKEASTTIEGSVNSAKAAYSNWLTSLGDENANLSDSTQKLLDSLITAASNIIPRLVQIFKTLGQFVQNNVGQIVEQIGTVIQANAPNWAQPIIQAFSVIPQVIKWFGGLDDGIKTTVVTVAALIAAIKPMATIFKAIQATASNTAKKITDFGTKAKASATKVKALCTTANLAKGALAALASAALALVISEAVKYIDHINKMKTATQGLVDTAKNAPAQLDSTASSIKNMRASVEDASTSMGSFRRSAEEALQSQVDLANNLNEKWKTLQTSADTVSHYVDIIEQLADKTNLSATEQLQLKTAVDQVNSICGTNIEVIDAQNGKLSESIEQIKQQTAAWIDNAKAQAAQESLVEVEKELIESQKDLSTATKDYQTAKNALDESMKDPSNASQWASMSSNVDTLKNKMDEAQKKTDALKDSEQTYLDVLNGSATTIMNAINQNNSFKDSLSNIGMSVETATSNLKSFGLTATDVQTLSTEQFTYLAQNSTASVDEIANRFESLNWSVPESMRSMLENAGYAIDENGHIVKDDADAVATAAVDATNKDEEAKEYGTALAQGYADAIAEKQALAENDGTIIADAAGTGINSNSSSASTWGYDLGANFGNGLSSAVGFVKGCASGIASAVQGILGHSIPKDGILHNHGKGEIPWGEHLVQNIAKGMLNAQGQVVSAANKIADLISAPLSNINADIGVNTKSLDAFNNFNSYKNQASAAIQQPQTINNYYIGDTKLTTYSEQQFAQDFIALMKRYGRLATT